MVSAVSKLLLSLGLTAALAFPSMSAAAEPKSKGILTLAIKRRMNLMNPLVNTGSTEHNIRTLMFEPLLGMALKGSIQPQLEKVGLNVKLNRVERGTGLALRRSGKFAFRTGAAVCSVRGWTNKWQFYFDYRDRGCV